MKFSKHLHMFSQFYIPVRGRVTKLTRHTKWRAEVGVWDFCSGQLLMTEIFKTQHSLNPTFMKEIFIPKNNQYALRNENLIKLLRP